MVGMGRREINQYDVFWVNLDPTIGSEISKKRPCVVISPDEMNEHLNTVIVAPLTSTIKKYLYRVDCVINGKAGSIALDQIKTTDKVRFENYIGKLSLSEINSVRDVLREMLTE